MLNDSTDTAKGAAPPDDAPRWRRRREVRLGEDPTALAPAAAGTSPPAVVTTTAAWWYACATVDVLSGDRLRLLLVVDEHARACRTISITHDLDERRIVDELEQVARRCGYPAQVCALSAPGFLVDAVEDWARLRGISSMPAASSAVEGTYARSLLHEVRMRMRGASIINEEHARAIANELAGATPIAAPEAAPARSDVTVEPGLDAPAPATAASFELAPMAAQLLEQARSEPPPQPGRLARWSIRLVVALSIILLVVLGLGPLTGRYRTSPILANSMSPTYRVGDVVLLTPTPPGKVRAGDVIQFSSPENVRELITHRVVEVRSGNPTPTFITKGDANRSKDPWVIKIEQDSAWQVRGHLPWVGWIVRAFISTTGIIALAVALSVLLLSAALHLLRRA